MKMPNGFGSVYKLSGKRRKPFVARKTIGWNDKGQPIYQFIGYYEKRPDALKALVEFNQDPYDLNKDTITFGEVYDKWTEQHFPKVSHSNVLGIQAAYKLCGDIQNMKIAEIKISHLQRVVDQSGKNYPTLRKLKVMFGLLYDYAVINELVSHDKREMVRFLDIKKAGNPNRIDRTPFTTKEISLLWKYVDQNERLTIPLILIYTGLRIGEFWNLKKEDVHLDERWFFVRESKTDSGIREVPIAEKIVPFFEKWMKHDSEYMFPNSHGKRHNDRTFRDSWWSPMMDELSMNHRPHDTRHTCVSLLTTAGVDSRVIKKIVGHKGQGVTEQVYTHLELPIKLGAINKI